MLASFASYALEKKVAKDPSQFGKGAIQGVAGPESANNAGAQTSFIPLLTLGIPENAVMALMVGAMTIHNIQPGPQVMTSQPGTVLGPDRVDVGRQPDAGRAEPAADRDVDQVADRCPTASSIRRSCCSAGSASTRSTTRASTSCRRPPSASSACLFLKLECEPAPLLLGFVLGPMMEENLRRAHAAVARRSDRLLHPPAVGRDAGAAAVLLLLIIVLPDICAEARRSLPGGVNVSPHR